MLSLINYKYFKKSVNTWSIILFKNTTDASLTNILTFNLVTTWCGRVLCKFDIEVAIPIANTIGISFI